MPASEKYHQIKLPLSGGFLLGKPRIDRDVVRASPDAETSELPPKNLPNTRLLTETLLLDMCIINVKSLCRPTRNLRSGDALGKVDSPMQKVSPGP
jgi:hypothetical protein